MKLERAGSIQELDGTYVNRIRKGAENTALLLGLHEPREKYISEGRNYTSLVT